MNDVSYSQLWLFIGQYLETMIDKSTALLWCPWKILLKMILDHFVMANLHVTDATRPVQSSH